jgi:hypothetical protein
MERRSRTAPVKVRGREASVAGLDLRAVRTTGLHRSTAGPRGDAEGRGPLVADRRRHLRVAGLVACLLPERTGAPLLGLLLIHHPAVHVLAPVHGSSRSLPPTTANTVSRPTAITTRPRRAPPGAHQPGTAPSHTTPEPRAERRSATGTGSYAGWLLGEGDGGSGQLLGEVVQGAVLLVEPVADLFGAQAGE